MKFRDNANANARMASAPPKRDPVYVQKLMTFGGDAYLQRDSNLANYVARAAKQGTISFWALPAMQRNLIASVFDSQFSTVRLMRTIFDATYESSSVERMLYVEFPASTNARIYRNHDISGTYSKTLTHYLLTFDSVGDAMQLAINGELVNTTSGAQSDTNIFQFGGWVIGAAWNGSSPEQTGPIVLADFWLDDAFYDLTTQANIDRFIDPETKRPVNLGENGELGSSDGETVPLVFFGGPNLNQYDITNGVNYGRGGNFTSHSPNNVVVQA